MSSGRTSAPSTPTSIGSWAGRTPPRSSRRRRSPVPVLRSCGTAETGRSRIGCSRSRTGCCWRLHAKGCSTGGRGNRLATPGSGGVDHSDVWTSRQPSRRSGHSGSRGAHAGRLPRLRAGRGGGADRGGMEGSAFRMRLLRARGRLRELVETADRDSVLSITARPRRRPSGGRSCCGSSTSAGVSWYSSRGFSCSRSPGRPSSRTRSIAHHRSLPCLLRPAHRSTPTSANIASARSRHRPPQGGGGREQLRRDARVPVRLPFGPAVAGAMLQPLSEAGAKHQRSGRRARWNVRGAGDRSPVSYTSTTGTIDMLCDRMGRGAQARSLHRQPAGHRYRGIQGGLMDDSLRSSDRATLRVWHLLNVLGWSILATVLATFLRIGLGIEAANYRDRIP